MTPGSRGPARGKTVGERIRERRLELGLSQRQLETKGVSYAYISRIESNGRTPSLRVLRQLALGLGVTMHWLETGEDDPAHELAQIVLEHIGKPLPRRAAALARQLLKQPA